MMYNAWDYSIFGMCPSSCILNIMVWEVNIFRQGVGYTYLVGSNGKSYTTMVILPQIVSD
jgi:hypothetical protein